MFITIKAPTKLDLNTHLGLDVPEGNNQKNQLRLDVEDEKISAQIAQMKDIKWSVKIEAPTPLKPADYIGIYSLIPFIWFLFLLWFVLNPYFHFAPFLTI
jgi:hypothetical protein